MTTDYIPLGDLINRLRRLDMERAATVYVKVGARSFPVGDISAINHVVTLHVFDEEDGTIQVKVGGRRTDYGAMFDVVRDINTQVIEMIRSHDKVTNVNERGALATESQRAVEALQALIGLLKLPELGERF